MKQIIFIKYGELTTKKANRNLFINILYQNIKDSLKNYQVKITKNRVRMYIETDDNTDEIIDILKNIFGIHSIVVANRVNTNIEEIKKNVLEIASSLSFKTFKVETKRSDKNFAIKSPEFNELIGSFLLKNIKDIKVDVHNPDFLLKIEIREDYTYIYNKEIKGSGGYPVKVAGRGLLMLSGGIDSPVATYLAMKRGVEVECIYFESPPHTSMQAKNKVKKLVKILTKYQPKITLHIINFTDIQEQIYMKCNPNYMMYRISQKVMEKRGALVLINGESISQVASQTLTSMYVINNVINCPVIRPVACLDKLEIIEIAKKIGTYETSILPYEDCCTIFLPKHPVINPNLETAIAMENNFDYEKLIEEAVNNMETIKIDNSEDEFII